MRITGRYLPTANRLAHTRHCDANALHKWHALPGSSNDFDVTEQVLSHSTGFAARVRLQNVTAAMLKMADAVKDPERLDDLQKEVAACERH